VVIGAGDDTNEMRLIPVQFIEVPFIHSNHPIVSRLLNYEYIASDEKIVMNE
jgi:hypothetical protein